MVGVDDGENLNQPKSCPSMASCCRGALCPAPHLSFLIQRNLLQQGGAPGTPFSNENLENVCTSSRGVWERLHSSQAVQRKEGCYSPLFQHPQPHLSVFVDAKQTNPMKLGQLGQQYAKQ